MSDVDASPNHNSFFKISWLKEIQDRPVCLCCRYCVGCNTFNRIVSLFAADNQCITYSNFDKLKLWNLNVIVSSRSHFQSMCIVHDFTPRSGGYAQKPGYLSQLFLNERRNKYYLSRLIMGSSGIFLLYFMNKFWPIQASCFTGKMFLAICLILPKLCTYWKPWNRPFNPWS